MQRALAPLGELICLPRAGLVHKGHPLCGDLAQPAQLAASLRTLRPTLILIAERVVLIPMDANSGQTAKKAGDICHESWKFP